MSNLISQNEDGSITYNDPKTGETMVVSEGDEEYEDMMMMKSLIDDDLNPENVKKIPTPSEPELKDEKDTNPAAEVSNVKPQLRSKRLKVGEYIEVYISNVSKQSNQFRVTTNPLVKGQKAKDIKKEAGTKKKLDRLKKSFGGNFNRINALKGTECEGIVKAASKTGDWVYVQPGLEDLPVGIGALGTEELSGLSAGDNVRVRISGIDEERGQLSLEVLGKI
jgi:ribosomal protein S1